MHSIRRIYVNPNLIRNIHSARSVCALHNVAADGKKTLWSINKVCLPLYISCYIYILVNKNAYGSAKLFGYCSF